MLVSWPRHEACPWCTLDDRPGDACYRAIAASCKDDSICVPCGNNDTFVILLPHRTDKTTSNNCMKPKGRPLNRNLSVACRRTSGLSTAIFMWHLYGLKPIV